MDNPADWSAAPSGQLYCQFRSGPILELKVGPRGGMWARIGSEWKRVRPTRRKPNPLSKEKR